MTLDLASAMRGLYDDEARKMECDHLREINAELLAAMHGVLKYYGEINVRKDYNKVVAHNAAIKAIRKATGETP